MKQKPTHTTGSLCPSARTDNLVTTASGSELIVYDEERHHIHHLDPISAAVWRLCDGHNPYPDLTRLAARELGTPMTEEVIRLALTRLEGARLLAHPLPLHMRIATSSRRSMLKRTAGAVALPMVVSISAPHAAAAASLLDIVSRCQDSPEAGGCWEDCHCTGNQQTCVGANFRQQVPGLCI